jgi:hypothetical protein
MSVSAQPQIPASAPSTSPASCVFDPFLGCGVAVDQFLERQRLPVDQPQQRVAEEVRVVAVVELKRHFVQVGGQVLRRKLVVAADDGALEQRPDALDRVRVDDAANPLALIVRDEFMGGIGVTEA